MNEDDGRIRLLQIIQDRIGQLKVKSLGEAEELFLSMVDDANPIKELLLMYQQREDYRDIANRLRESLGID